MALPNNFSVYDETGTNRLYYNDEYMFPTMTTVYSFLTANVPGVRYISKTIGGTPYSDNASMRDLYNDGAYTVYAIPFPKTIAGQIERLQYDKNNICVAIENKGVTVGNVTLDDYAACIDAIQQGGGGRCIDFLVIGGGGAGGGIYCGKTYGCGGGGGAGGYIECYGYDVGDCTSFGVTIGTGGVGVYREDGNNGGDSCFGDIIAYGGGGGGGYMTNVGHAGGSGGGGAAGSSGREPSIVVARGGAGCCGQGHNGGYSYCCCRAGGGGGGAGAEGGGNGITGSNKGGDGKQSSITGTLTRYAGGGGSCSGPGNGSSGCGGGGDGRGPNGTGTSGKDGIVVVRYLADGSCGISSATGGTKYTCGDYTIHCFTSNGTFCIVS